MNYCIKLIFIFYAFPLSLFAQTDIKSIESSSEERIILTVAIEDTGYFPFNYNKNDELSGFSIDVLKYISENSNYSFKFITAPWARTLQLISHGKADIGLALFKPPEREKIFHYIEPSYGSETNQLFTLIDNKIEFNGQLSQLTPYYIGVVREYSYGKAFDNAHYLKKASTLSEDILLKLLLAKRVDAVVANPIFFSRYISKKNVASKIKPIEPYISITPIHMVLTKNREDSKEIQKKLGQLIKKLKASPYYQELLDQYVINWN